MLYNNASHCVIFTVRVFVRRVFDGEHCRVLVPIASFKRGNKYVQLVAALIPTPQRAKCSAEEPSGWSRLTRSDGDLRAVFRGDVASQLQKNDNYRQLTNKSEQMRGRIFEGKDDDVTSVGRK